MLTEAPFDQNLRALKTTAVAVTRLAQATEHLGEPLASGANCASFLLLFLFSTYVTRVRSSYSALRRKTIQCCFTELKKSNDDVFAAYTDETRMSGGPLGRAYVILQSLNINTTTTMMPER